MTYARASRHSAIIALVAIACLAAAMFVHPRAVLVSYLAAAVTISAIPVGSLAVLMIGYLVRGNWTTGLHVPLTAAALTMPMAGILFVPVLIAIPWLYPWAHGAGASGFKAFYLSPWLFVLRTVIYFVAWTALALWVRSSWAEPRRMIAAASAGLIVYALTASLAGVDWLESLTPQFHSSIYGLLFLTFQILAGLAFALVIALAQPGAPTFSYGAILLSALLLWAYNHAMQYIIIWSGNIPDEVVWYLNREAGVWSVMLWALITLQFILPFFAMLSSSVRNQRMSLLALAALTLGLRFLEALVMAAPGNDVDDAILLLSFPAAILGIGGIWLITFLFALGKAQASPHDNKPLPDTFAPAGSISPVRSRS